MKRTLFFIRSPLTLLGLFIFTFSFGQGYFLPIHPIPQKASKWCYAASMEMVIDFHEDSDVDQCNIAARRFEISSNSILGSKNIDCCSFKCVNDYTTTNNCNNTIDYPKKRNSGSGIIKQVSYFDLIFSSLGFMSTEEIQTDWMTWENTQKEIESCRPFMIMLEKGKTSGNRDYDYNHVVVAIGYYEDSDADQWLLVNDPEIDVTCEGKTILLPHNVLTAYTPFISQEISYSYNNALAMVRFIQPKNKKVCICCKDLIPSETNSLIIDFELLKERIPFSQSDVQSIDSNILDYEMKNQEDYFLNNLIISDATGENLRSLKIMVARGGEKEITVTLEKGKNNESWLIREISNAANTPYVDMIKVPIPGVMNQKKLCASKNEIEVVNYLPDFLKFYRYKHENQTYLTPIRDYEGIAKKGEYYLEDYFLELCNK